MISRISLKARTFSCFKGVGVNNFFIAAANMYANMMTSHTSFAFNNSSNTVNSIDEFILGIESFIPKLTQKLHKGECGRIGVIGGSLEYTGAPYFSAISALKLGADLAYVICCREAATVIKSYSPELIVYPFLDDPQPVQRLSPYLEKLHSLIIGPGLGRDPGILKNVEAIIHYCNSEMKTPLPLIIDADGLFLITQKINLIKQYKGLVILTPNAVEYSRLCQKMSVEESEFFRLAEELNAIIVKKGETDIICNGIHKTSMNLPDDSIVLHCNFPGSARRCGGQGDILSGCVAVFVAWFILNKNKNPNATSHLKNLENVSNDVSMNSNFSKERYIGFSMACLAGCSITRHSSNIAFAKHGRSMTASDIISFIPIAFENIFGK